MNQRTVLGIDLGTTYSCVAHLDEFGKPVVLINGEGKTTTPSVVYFEDAQNAVVGEQAKNELARYPDKVVSEIKRQMGVEDFFLHIDGRDFYPPQISALILRSIVEDALEALNAEAPADGPIADVVISVPAYFGGAERAATKQAGELAGLEVIRIINEPTAAAIAYGLTKQGNDRRVLVYDLGGGTFDVTIIRISEEEIRGIATGGDRRLGGLDWDQKLVDLFLDRFEEQQPDAGDPRDDKEAVGELKLKAEQAKQGLSTKSKYGMSVTANLTRAQFDVKREEFEALTQDLVARTLEMTDLVLEAAKKNGEGRIDEVILVGGMSKMPYIGARLAEHLRERFPDLPEPRLQDPDQIVAKGAALFAASRVVEIDPDPLNPSPRPTLPGPPMPDIIDITSKAYGVKAVRDVKDEIGYVSFIIQQNDALPIDKKERYHTLYDNQTEVEIAVFEQATDVLDGAIEANTKLIHRPLTGLPPGQPAGQPVDVTFRLGDEGILYIHAESNGRELHLEWEMKGQAPPDPEPRPVLVR